MPWAVRETRHTAYRQLSSPYTGSPVSRRVDTGVKAFITEIRIAKGR